ncbi:MAG: hypothetical protein ACXVFN_01265 [Solirubrobacteraceae bacterium]
MLRKRNWWSFTPAVLLLAGFLVLPGALAILCFLAALVAFAAACIRGLVLQARDDPDRVRPVAGIGLMGMTAVEESRKRRRHEVTRPSPPQE